MKTYSRLFFVFLIAIGVCSKNLNAQSYTINQGGTITTCSGTLYDSDSTANYQNNENYTITFCSNGAGNIINLGFAVLFDIDPSDTLFIYNGNSTASPLIGAYNNNNPPVGVSSTTSNTSGCITLQFVSDGAITDTGWSASIGCVMICQPITPVITTTPALVNYGPDSTYTNICPGDTVLFSATGTYPDNGVNPVNYVQSDATSTFEWSLGVGNVVNTQSASEVYPNPQGYLIILTMTDVNGCIETVRHKVRTGIPPTFSGVFVQPDTSCFGDTINLIGGFNQTTTAPPGVTTNTGVVSAGGTVAGQTFLPDGSGVSYSTSVNISGFAPQTIVNGTDIAEVCMNIEHSYIGDLTIELSCPNGTTIMLSDTYNGTSPGNTFLGDADDSPAPSTTPGIGLDYCFDLGAAWGTMNTENNNSNWIPSTVTSGNNILTPGSFQPEQNFSGLIGCPIDGNWTITITDNIGIDNGYIFEWSILLNPAINPNAEFYTVNILNGIWLTSPSIIVDYDTLALAVPGSAGISSYIFEVTDEYGCNFDTTVQVFVLDELTPVASPDTIVCLGQQVTLDINTVSTCVYSLDLYDSFGDGWNNAILDVFINGAPFLTNITVPNCGGASCNSTFNIPVTTGDIITMNYTGGTFDNENDVTLYDAGGNLVFTINDPPDGFIGGNITVVCGALLNYLWSPATGLNDPTINNPIFNGSTTSSYTVTTSYTNFPQCSATSDSILLEVKNDPDPLVLGDSIVCIGNGIMLSVSDAISYLWPDGSTGSSVSFIPSADTLITVTASNFCDTFVLNRNIVVNPNPTITILPDTSIVVQESIKIITTGGGSGANYTWSPSDGLNCTNCQQPIASPIETTTYTVEVIDSNGCKSYEYITIDVLLPDLFIPTGFSPNNDGFNDAVFVRSLDIKTMVLQIYNRWGGLVFETEDQKIGWDGTSNGKKLDFGVYVYRFEATLLSGERVTQSGSITLFR